VTDIPDDSRVRPFALTLQEIGAGKLAARVSEQLADLTSAVVATDDGGLSRDDPRQLQLPLRGLPGKATA
jgi:hypothetical protein